MAPGTPAKSNTAHTFAGIEALSVTHRQPKVIHTGYAKIAYKKHSFQSDCRLARLLEREE